MGLSGVDELLRREVERPRTPGVAVAVVGPGGAVLHANGYGFADMEHRVPVTVDTVFQSGSVGKQFTAAIVLLLQEDGLIDVDDLLSAHWVDVPDAWRAITVRHLLTHTSGLPAGFEGDVVDPRRDYSEDELLEISFSLPLEFPPGSRWNYSNVGYVVLGVLIHVVSGSFYGDLLSERIFTPLGMETARVISEVDIVPDRAAGYRLVAGQVKNQEWVSPSLCSTADGSLYLTLRDLITWDAGWRAGTILRPQSSQMMFEPVRLNSGNPYPYGFGWSVEEVGGRHRHRHGGAWQGFTSHLVRYLEEDLTVIVLANSSETDAKRLADTVAAIVEPSLGAPADPPDPDLAADTRTLEILTRAGEGRLTAAGFSFVPSWLFPRGVDHLRDVIGPIGTCASMSLLSRDMRGDDRVYRYRVELSDRILEVDIAYAPDDLVSSLDVSRVAPS